MFIGLAYAIAACAIWGLIYIFPLLLPQYDPALIASARFAFYGAGCLFLAYFQREKLKTLTFVDWVYAFKLAFFGSLVYYCSLVAGVQLAGAPVAGMFMCCIPVLVAIISNYRSRSKGTSVAWSRLSIPLVLIALGMVVANWTEFAYMVNEHDGSAELFWLGVGFSALSMLLWTWYPIRNADWLLANKRKGPKVWATAQGLSILPVTVIGYFALALSGMTPDGSLFGPEPGKFLILMLIAGVVCGWMGAALWNAMSERLPTALAGQLIVFETIFSVIYAHIWRGQWPTVSMVIGMVMLLLGVLAAMRVFRQSRVQS